MVEAGLTEKVVSTKTFSFFFSDPGELSPPVMSFQNVGFSYSGDMNKGALYKNLSLAVDLDSRVALVGPNGAGKSTLLKLMLGELTPTVGAVRRHFHLRLGRYNQHSNDQLDLDLTPLRYMQKTFPEEKLEEESWRTAIGRYGISGAQQSTQISQLSDGQKSRIVFAVIAQQKPHVLLLDEPTNHLDIEAIDSLAVAINKFKGGLVLVSHDFRLIDQVAKVVWVCDDNDVKPWKGDIHSYKKYVSQKMAQFRP